MGEIPFLFIFVSVTKVGISLNMMAKKIKDMEKLKSHTKAKLKLCTKLNKN